MAQEDSPKGRGTAGNSAARLPGVRDIDPADDGWPGTDALLGRGDAAADPEAPTPDPDPATEVTGEAARSALTHNDSPDIPFERSINPYRGCEHGCSYCYARPSHAYLDLSPGLDFETRLVARRGLAERLRDRLAKPGYEPATVALGANTDPYQPIERRERITRDVLAVLAESRHPVTLITKSALVTRDLDLLQPLAEAGAVQVMVSITTLDRQLARAMEPRAATPKRRLAAVATLAAAGIPTGVMMAPVIPGLTDSEIEALVAAAAQAGAQTVNHVLLRLPHEVGELFTDWLERCYPQRKDRVLSLLRQCRDGQVNDSRFGRRLRGTGPVAQLIDRRLAAARQRQGLAERLPALCTAAFAPPQPASGQLRLV